MIKMRCRVCKMLFIGENNIEAEKLFRRHKCLKKMGNLSDKELLRIVVSGLADSWYVEG